jgi:hypothetical protein
MSDIELFPVKETAEGLARRFFHSERFGAGILAEEIAKDAAKGRIAITLLEIDDPLMNRKSNSYLAGYVSDDAKAKGFISLYLDLM